MLYFWTTCHIFGTNCYIFGLVAVYCGLVAILFALIVIFSALIDIFSAPIVILLALVAVFLDYLFYFRDLAVVAKHKQEIKVKLSPYAGIGSSVQISEGSTPLRLGLRAPLGLAFLFSPGNLELFAEIALGIHIFPSTTALIDGGIGARWFF